MKQEKHTTRTRLRYLRSRVDAVLDELDAYLDENLESGGYQQDLRFQSAKFPLNMRPSLEKEMMME
jgi:hypothetical protein